MLAAWACLICVGGLGEIENFHALRTRVLLLAYGPHPTRIKDADDKSGGSCLDCLRCVVVRFSAVKSPVPFFLAVSIERQLPMKC
jgi:hypothetical protein